MNDDDEAGSRLRPWPGTLGWWVVRYSRKRKNTPVLLRGPFESLTECQQVIREMKMRQMIDNRR